MVPETDQAVRDEVNDRVPAGEAISPLRFYFRQTIPVGINPADAAGLPELDAETIANVIGGLDENTDKRTGIQALRDAEAEAKLTPKVLIAPQFSQNAAVAQALLSVADELRAVAIIDGPDATVKQAIDTATELTHKRAFMVDYWPRVFDPTRAEEVTEPPSARVAGLISKVDAEKGFHWSPSNQVINGVLGTSRPCDFSLQNRNTTGQILNEAGVAVIANVNGWRLMGNRTTSIDPLWVYLPVRRTADMIYEAIEQGHQWALDRPFSAQLIRDLRDGVATYLRQLQARGVILGGNVWINSEFNTAADLQAGRLTIGFDFEPPAPAEHLIFRAERNGTYYDELIRQVAAV
ncbi:MAG: phage tail sheath subtilisin-like domain-containing protein [Pseudomonadota bacterium]